MDQPMYLDASSLSLETLRGLGKSRKLIVTYFSLARQEVRDALMELSDAGIALVFWEEQRVSALQQCNIH